MCLLTRLMHADNLQQKLWCIRIPEHITGISVVTMIFAARLENEMCSQCTHYCILKTKFSFTNAVTNEGLWLCTQLQHNWLLQLINSVETFATKTCLRRVPKRHNPPDLNQGFWRHKPGSIKATFSHHKYVIPVFCAVHSYVPSRCNVHLLVHNNLQHARLSLR